MPGWSFEIIHIFFRKNPNQSRRGFIPLSGGGRFSEKTRTRNILIFKINCLLIPLLRKSPPSKFFWCQNPILLPSVHFLNQNLAYIDIIKAHCRRKKIVFYCRGISWGVRKSKNKYFLIPPASHPDHEITPRQGDAPPSINSWEVGEISPPLPEGGTPQ